MANTPVLTDADNESNNSNQPENTPKIPPHLQKQLRVKPWLPEGPPQPILFLNANVVDPETSTITSSHVYVKDGTICSIDSAKSQPKPRDGDRVVDLHGLHLCPGLIDCHVHVCAVPGVRTMAEAMSLPEQVVSLRSTYVLKEMLARGFTTVRDTGGATAALAQTIDEWLIPGPRLIQCGKALSQTGGHGDARSASETSDSSCCGGHSRGLGRTCDGVPQVLATVRDELRKGAQFIKIMCGGGVASPTDSLESIQFTAEEIRAITTTCKQMGGFPSTAHAYTPAAIRHALDNGVMGIEHGNMLDAATARYMAARGAFLTPTLSCYGIMVRPPFEEFLDADGKAKNAEVMRRGLEAIRIAEDAGVTVCYGTDLLVSMHALQTEEFSVRSRVLPSPKILKHATTNAAKMLRMEGKIGKIQTGAYADLIVLNENPLDDITSLDRPEKNLLAVLKGGLVYRSKLDDLTQDSLP